MVYFFELSNYVINFSKPENVALIDAGPQSKPLCNVSIVVLASDMVSRWAKVSQHPSMI